MKHHEPKIPELPPSPPPAAEVDPSSTYGTPPDSGPDGTGPLHDDLSLYPYYISSDAQY